MSTNKTTNYNLNQWVKSDQVLMEEFNDDNAKIDAALKAHDTILASKASTSALNSLKTTVNGKASTSALTELKTTVDGLKTGKADKSALTSLQSTVTSQGTSLGLRNCQVYLTTHAGDGGATPTFTFPRKPWLVIFFRYHYHGLVALRGGTNIYAIGGSSSDFGTVTYQFSGNNLKFTEGGHHVNGNGATYTVFALLEV